MGFLEYQFDTVGVIIAISLITLVSFQIIYYIVVYGRSCFYKATKTDIEVYPSVSVVICAKDEAYNLEKRLPIILEQQYPNFEVVVVNDASKDESEYILRVLQEIYPNLNVVNLYENVNKFLGKKYPLSIGIKSAKNEIILLTEADTQPSSYNWITEMVKGFNHKTQMVIGYSNYEIKNNFLNSLIQYEHQTTAMNYLGHAILKHPYMGTGRNLAFTKKMFFSVNGFISQYNIPVGEDQLFVNKYANAKNSKVVITKDSINLSASKERFYEWIIKKKKDYRSLSYFKLKDKITTSLIPITTILLYILIVISIISRFPWEYLVMGLIIKYTIQILIYFKTSRKLGTKQLAFLAPIYEILFLFFNTIIRISSLLTKRDKWKY
ncbi:MAG: glycosyltransferase [Bacteroidales bacterium]